ncbi:MAG TPA: hypothetical protein VE136_13100, partial [Anaerolineales bacterium]|nr:hypothetical protein [Anaerolineales bacterium]
MDRSPIGVDRFIPAGNHLHFVIIFKRKNQVFQPFRSRPATEIRHCNDRRRALDNGYVAPAGNIYIGFHDYFE